MGNQMFCRVFLFSNILVCCENAVNYLVNLDYQRGAQIFEEGAKINKKKLVEDIFSFEEK